VAHSLSAKKRVRQNTKRRMLNRSRLSALKNKLRRCRELLHRGSPAEAETAVRDAFKALDRESDRRTIHKNEAARRKSRLTRRLNALKAANQG
jgi:small subunit ribosomal protein S20